MSARYQELVGAWAVETWNRSMPRGSLVYVMLDDRSERHGVTESCAWQLGGGEPVVKVEGISGGFSLWRVRSRDAEPKVD